MKKTIRDIDVQGKRVFVRNDFNVPVSDDGTIVDSTRIDSSLATLRALLDGSPQALILASHMGRPKGKVKPELSLKPVADDLTQKLGRAVTFVPDATSEEAIQKVHSAPAGSVFLLENLRFHPGETKGDEALAEQLGKFADVYVNDAFGTSHRAHASTHTLPSLMPVKVAGLLVEKELEFLQEKLASPERPFHAVLGGAKVTDKIDVITSLLGKVDGILIGGAMAYPFLKVQDIAIGKSMCAEEDLGPARDILAKAKDAGITLHLPQDHVVIEEFSKDAPTHNTDGQAIDEDWLAIDIGKKTQTTYHDALASAKTIFWNGPMGVYEFPGGKAGSNTVAQVMADSSGLTIVGGGDSVAAVNDLGVADQLSHVSTGGGASLELLEGKTLPGVEILDDK